MLPANASPTCASAAISPVPTDPNSFTTGYAPVSSASQSAVTTVGRSPAPPARSWLARTASIARTCRAGSSSPMAPAWLRRSRRPCPAADAVGTSSFRLAPTPVERPYTRPLAAICRAASQDSSTRFIASVPGTGRAAPSASRTTSATPVLQPSSTTRPAVTPLGTSTFRDDIER